MASINKVILIGNLGKNPDVQFSKSGVEVAKFSLATTESRKVNDNWENTTDWHNVILFNKQAAFAKSLKKGDSVYLEGKISYSSWEDESGIKKYKTDIIGHIIKSLTKIEKSTEKKEKQSNNEYDNENDLPF